MHTSSACVPASLVRVCRWEASEDGDGTQPDEQMQTLAVHHNAVFQRTDPRSLFDAAVSMVRRLLPAIALSLPSPHRDPPHDAASSRSPHARMIRRNTELRVGSPRP